MNEIDQFRELISRVRAGDQDAASEFVRQYEPAIRRAARIRMLDPRLAPLLDSLDIVQSVFTSFFVRAAMGQYELDQPEQALSLLVSMSRKKLAGHARKHGAQRRDYRRLRGDGRTVQHSAAGADPGQQIAAAELIEEFRKRLSPQERELADLRASGHNWDEIARRHGESAEALRKKLGRAVSRIARDLGVEEPGDE